MRTNSLMHAHLRPLQVLNKQQRRVAPGCILAVL